MLHPLVKILFPTPCLSCGFLDEPLCNRCFHKLEFYPHVRKLEDILVCCSMFYQKDSILDKLIRPFKYQHQADIFRLFVPHMIQALKLLMEPRDLVLVPVPLHPRRKLERGYNQAELLAKWISREVGCGMLSVLKRVRETESQALTESRAERIQNMRGAFQVCGPLPEGRQIVLVDDIVTTGSTLLACKEALESAGARKVRALTLADRE